MHHSTNEINIIYGAYARKSSESEDRQIQSIDTQTDQILALAEKEQLQLFDAPYQESQSAFNPGRELFNELVKQTYAGKVNAWLCYHPNRLSRNPIDGGTIIYLMDIGLLHHIKTPNRTYYNNSNDKMCLQFEFVFSKKDSDDKSQFVKDGLEKRYSKGLPTGKAPLGFLNDISKEKGDRDWLVDKERLAKVELLLKQFLKGNDSIRTLTQFARENLKLRTVQRKRQGGALITRSGIEHLLKDPIYAGFFYSKDQLGNFRTRRTLNSNLPRLITFSEHEQIKAMLAAKCHTKKQHHNAVYSGLITGKDGGFIGADHKFQLICDCKYKFAYRSKTHCPKCKKNIDQLKNPKYLSYTYYYNVRRTKEKKKAKRIEEKKVEQFILHYIQNYILMQPEFINWSVLHLKYLELQKLEELQIKQQAKADEMALIERKRSKLNELYYADVLSTEEYKKERDRLEIDQKALHTSETHKKASYEAITNFIDIISNVQEIFKNGDQEDKKHLLLQLGSNLIWNEEKLLFLKPKWLLAYEKARNYTITHFKEFEPKINVENKGQKADFGAICPTMLRYWDDVRTLKNIESKTTIEKTPHY